MLASYQLAVFPLRLVSLPTMVVDGGDICRLSSGMLGGMADQPSEAGLVKWLPAHKCSYPFFPSKPEVQ